VESGINSFPLVPEILFVEQISGNFIQHVNRKQQTFQEKIFLCYRCWNGKNFKPESIAKAFLKAWNYRVLSTRTTFRCVTVQSENCLSRILVFSFVCALSSFPALQITVLLFSVFNRTDFTFSTAEVHFNPHSLW